MLASTMKKSNNQKPNQRNTPHSGRASDASDTQQRAIPTNQENSRSTIVAFHYPNTP